MALSWPARFLASSIFATLAGPALGQMSNLPGTIDAENPRCMWMRDLPAVAPNIRNVLALAKAAKLQKDEYETEQAFQVRAVAALSKIAPNQGRIWADVPIYEGYGKYDADRGLLKYEAGDLFSPLDMVLSYKNSKQTTYMAAPQSQRAARATEYIGQNSFGAVAKVKTNDRTLFEVGYKEVLAERDLSFPSRRELSIPIPPEQARTMRPRLRLVLGGALSPPYWIDEERYSRATVLDPVDLSETHHIAIISQPCGMIVDSATGRSLAVFEMPPR